MTYIAILGFGNVGSGVAEVLTRNMENIRATVGDEISIKYVLDKRDLSGTPYADAVVSDIDVILNDPEVSVVCEMLGGINIKTAYKLLKSGAIKSFIIGNKYLIPKINVFEYLELVDNKT